MIAALLLLGGGLLLAFRARRPAPVQTSAADAFIARLGATMPAPTPSQTGGEFNAQVVPAGFAAGDLGQGINPLPTPTPKYTGRQLWIKEDLRS